MRKITRNSLKELIRQSIKELDFKDKESFKKYQSQHKMRSSTKVNIGGKDTTVGQAIDVGGPSHPNVPKKKKGGEDGGCENKPMWPDGKPNEKSPNKLSGKDQLKKDAEYQKNATDKYGDYIEKTASSKMSDSAKKRLARDLMNKDFEIPESVRKPRKATVKEVKKWFKTLEENRYKKTYNSDARRVSWLVNNNLSEDYEAMPISMKKKWPKAAYKRERFLAKEYLKHLKSKYVNELKMSKLKKLIREVIVKEGKLFKEAKETIFDVAARVVKNHQAEKWKGSLMDATSANLLVKVFKKENPKMKKILSDLGNKDPKQLMATLWAVVK